MQLHYKHRIQGGEFIIKEVYNLCGSVFYVEENQFGHKACSTAVYMENVDSDEQLKVISKNPLTVLCWAVLQHI